MKRFFIISLCFCSILLFCLTGCSKQETKGIESKVDAELEYVEDLIFKIANKYAKGEYFEDNKTQWEYIKGDINKINSSWSSLVLDLIEVNVQNKDIMEFSNHLNDLLITVSKEDDVALIEKLDNMYGKIIVFREAYVQDKNKIQKNKIKDGVLNIYSLSTKNDWTTAKSKVDTLIDTYKSLMNDIGYAEENGYNLNKVYVLLEEYKNSIETQNYDLVRLKYINAVENL